MSKETSLEIFRISKGVFLFIHSLQWKFDPTWVCDTLIESKERKEDVFWQDYLNPFKLKI